MPTLHAKGGAMEIGEAVRYWRARRAMYQGELAEKIGISQNSLSRIETGDSRPKMETIRKLAAALDVTVDDLTSSTAPPPPRRRKRRDAARNSTANEASQ